MTEFTKEINHRARLAFTSLDVLVNEIESYEDYDYLAEYVLGSGQVRVRDAVLFLLTKASDDNRLNAMRTVYAMHQNNVSDKPRNLGSLGVALACIHCTHSEIDPEDEFMFNEMLFTFRELIRNEDTDEEANLADLFIRAAKMMPFEEYAAMFADSIAQLDFLDCLVGA